MRAGKFGIIGLFLALSLTGAPGARAYTLDGTARPNWATPEGFTSPEFLECGLKCVYLQAVEKGSVKARYLLQTMNAVQAIAAAPGIEQYVDIQKFETAVRPECLFTDRSRGTLAAVSLAMWLRHSAPAAVSA